LAAIDKEGSFPQIDAEMVDLSFSLPVCDAGQTQSVTEALDQLANDFCK